MRKEEIMQKQCSNEKSAVLAKMGENTIASQTRNNLFKISTNNTELEQQLRDWAQSGFKSDKTTLERFGNVISPQMLKQSKLLGNKRQLDDEEDQK